MANQVKTTFLADTKPQDRAVAKLQTDLAKYKSQRERDEQALTRQIERNAEARARAEIRSLQSVQREIQRIRREEDRAAQQRSQTIAGYRQTAAGIIVGGAVGAGYLATQAIEKAVEQARANRLLASAATEAGLAQGKLADANKRFAESVGLSNVAAASTTSYIARLATYAGRPQDLDKLLRSFADLGAARGIGGRDLETLIGTILSGQDEGLNRLGISDPGQLQKAYAASLGKTTEELTQQEKVQAAVNAVMEKAAVFTGAAEARMNSLEGTVARTTAQWENFTNALSQTAVTSGPTLDFLSEYQTLLKGVSIEIDEVNKKLAAGQTPQQIAREAYPGPSTGDYLSAYSYLLSPAYFANARIGAFGQGARDATDPQKVYERRFQQFQQQIEAQRQSNEQQETAAYRTQVDNARKANEEFRQRQIEEVFGPKAIKRLEQELEKVLSLDLTNPNRTLEGLRQGLRQVQTTAGLDPLTRRDFEQRYTGAIQDEQKRQADELKKKFEELKKARESAFDIGLGTSTNPFVSLLSNATQRMRTLVETTKLLPPALREALQLQERGRNAKDLLGLRLDTRLDAYSLRNQAAEFRQGFRNDLSDPAVVQRILDAQLSILGGRFDPAKDQRLINIAQGLDPRLLRQDQQINVASAFEREASRKLDSERQAVDFYTAMQKLITGQGLKVSVAEGATLDVLVSDSTSTGVSTGTSGNVRGRYERR